MPAPSILYTVPEFEANNIINVLSPFSIKFGLVIKFTHINKSAGISRDHYHKRRATGGKRAVIRKKRKFELGRPAANTKVYLQSKSQEGSLEFIFLLVS